MEKQMFKLLTSPVDTPTDTGGELTKYDIEAELLKDDEPEIIPIDEKPAKRDSEAPKEDGEEEIELKETKEPDELEELEKELEGPDEKQLELMTPARRKDILAAYPDLFKKFPYLETAYYRDQKFTEFFPTFKEAEQAVEAVKVYNEIQQDLANGNIEGLVAYTKNDPVAFAKLVDNYMPTLAKIDRPAYEHILGNTIKHTIKAMVAEAEYSQSAALKTAATILNQFVFGNSTFQEPQNLSKQAEPNQAETELQRREQEFENRRFNLAQSELADRVNNSIKATIAENIDPKGSMTDYIKNIAVKDAMENVEKLIMKDTRFRTLVDRLWIEAARNDYDKPSMDKIKSACVSKARTLLQPVIKTARNEALRGMGKRVRDEEPQGNSRVPNNSDRTKGSKVPEGMTSLEYLNSDD